MTQVMLDRAPARLDPIGAAAAWGLAPLVSALAVGYAVLESIINRSEIVHPAFAVVAVILLIGAGVILSIAAHPSIARLGKGGAALAVCVTLSAAACSAFATWGHNRLVQDDWGQIGVGLIILGLLWMRPPWEIIVFGLLGALVVGVLAAEQHASLQIANTPYVYAVVAATPVLVLAAAAATSGAVLARYSTEWIAASERGMRALEPEFRNLEQEALRREQLEELRRATFPLLASVAERGEITPDDIVAATDVSAQLREHALQQLRITWVDRLREDAGIATSAVDDEDGLLARMPAGERATFSACLLELLRLGALDASTVAIGVRRAPTAAVAERAEFQLSAGLAADWRFARRAARPFVSVLRSLSGDAAITRNGSSMIMRFGFVAA